MSWRRSTALARHELKALQDDPGSLVFLLIMPLLMMWLMKPLFGLSLQSQGFMNANGAEQAVPGMAAMFATFTGSFAGFTFFREHGWNTWDRLRASPATTLDIMVGKLAPTLLIAFLQMMSLFGLGILVLDLTIGGSLAGLTMIVAAFSLTMVSFGMAVTAVSRTSLQLNTFVNLFGIVFAGVGGALVPLAVLPDWVQTAARLTPTFWAMEGFLELILHDGIAVDVTIPVIALTTFTALFSVVAAARFRVAESKVYVA